MKTWDLTAGAAKLEEAMKSLQTVSRELAESWNDDTRRRFQETYIEPLEPRLRNLLDALGRLAEVLSNAEHQCRDQSHE
jgi:uncharacterized protein YukE